MLPALSVLIELQALDTAIDAARKKLAQLIADGTKDAEWRLTRVLNSDCGMGVVRHADAGYETSIEIGRTRFRERGGEIPMI